MPQFTVYENINKQTKDSFPYLLDVQTNLLNGLNTRVVIPLCPSDALGKKSISNLSPRFEIKMVSHTLLTSQLAGIAISEIGPPVCDLSDHRIEIIKALDFLLTGF